MSKKLYSGILEAAAEEFLVTLFSGERAITMAEEGEVISMLVSPAMHIVSSAHWATPSIDQQIEDKEWGESPNPGGESKDEGEGDEEGDR